MSRLSVVVPAFNEEATIAECLDHLLNQTRPIDEIIVVDNASTDRTGPLVEEYVAEYPQVTLLHEPIAGVVAARRCGFDHASGDLIAKTDADTLVTPTWAAEMVDFFDSDLGHDYAAATGLVVMWDGPAYEKQRSMTLAGMGKLKDGGEIAGLHGPNYAIRADAWRQVRDQLSERSDIWEDLDLALELRELGLRRRFVPSMEVAASCRQLRHSPWANRKYILGGIRTAGTRDDRKVQALMYAELPFRVVTFTAMWLLFRPWDAEQENWRPHRLFTPLHRARPLITSGR